MGKTKLRKPIVKLGLKLTDDANLKMGLEKMDENRPEYWGLAAVMTDEQAELALKMDKRKPISAEKLAKRAHMDVEKCRAMLDEMCEIGILEYNFHNDQHEKRYVLNIFVVGMIENYILNNDLIEEKPEMGEFFHQMGYLPLRSIAGMAPPGGAGLGFRVVPVEKAIPSGSQAIPTDRLSYWLNTTDKYAVMPCVCRRAMRLRGEGCGELEEEICIAVGDYAEYIVETGRGHYATYDEIIELLQRAEDNGYMHQVTNEDGPGHIFAICNCHVGSCYALRCSQLFNAPNLSASCYRAKVDPEKCVACGKCVEVCPAGAPRLGQKLPTLNGTVNYPKQPLPFEDHIWGKKDWDFNYRDNNQRNCYDSGTAPCKTACPAHISIEGYIRMAKEGRYLDALKLIKQDNPFPAVCGSICNKRCEAACTRGIFDDPLSIDEIKKYIAEQEIQSEHRYIPKKIPHSGRTKPYDEKIAVIGAGPAGLSAAYFLSEMNYPVTVFDRNPQPGGMLRMGIPNFRLEKDVLDAEIDVLRQMGVEFRCGVTVGKDVTIQQLRDAGYKGFYVAIGAQGARKLGVPGEDESDSVISGVDFLREVAMQTAKPLPKRVAVIGGGNVAIDVARTAVRMGAEEITQFSLEQRHEMPAAEDEIEEAESEGIRFACGWGPKEIRVTGGRVESIILKRCTSVRDADGRFHPVYDENDLMELPCEAVLAAIGQSIVWDGLDVGDLVVTRRGTAEADPVTYQTAQPDIFVGGDCYSGPRFAIDAIAAGREGAVSLHRYVHKGQSLTLARNRRQFVELDKSNLALAPDCYDRPHRAVVARDAAKARTFADDRMLLTEEQIKAEASRCLECGATYVDQNKCIGCGLCTTRCNFDAIHLERNHPEAAKMVPYEQAVPRIMANGVKQYAKTAVKLVKRALDGSKVSEKDVTLGAAVTSGREEPEAGKTAPTA